MSATLVQKREELAAKQQALAAIFDEMKAEDGKLSLKQVKSIDGTPEEKQAEIKRRNAELGELGREVELLAAEDYVTSLGKRLNDPNPGLPMPVRVVNEEKSFGQLFMESEAFKNAPKGMSDGPESMLDVDAKAIIRAAGMKAVMSTGAGFAPQAIRSGDIVPIATRPIQLLDLIPSLDTSQANVVYMEETTFTNSAAEVSEGSSYAQSTIVYTERTSNVRKIGHYLPVTDEQLEDVPLVAGLVDSQLIFGVRQRLDQQVFNGDGNAPNLKGILNFTGLQTQAKGTDPAPDAVMKAIVKVRITGRANPDTVMMHPTDWQNLALLRTAEGVYIYGSPSEPGPQRMWGLAIAITDAGSAGTAVVGDVQTYCYLAYRRGLNTQVGFVNDDFIKGQKSIRADVRVAFVGRRGAAFCQVTGL